MPGFGIQKRGTSPLLVKRKKFSAGSSDPEYAEDMSSMHEGAESAAEEAKETKLEKEGYKETKGGKMVKDFAEGVKEGVKKVAEVPKKIAESIKKIDEKIKEDPGVMGTGDPKRKFKKSKSPEKDEPMKPMRKLKKGGLAKKGILIIIGTKDKKSKGMKK